jgi:hypothetical protein
MQRTSNHYLQSIRNLTSTSELEGTQVKHTQGQHIPKVLHQPNARSQPLFIAPSQIEPLYPFTRLSSIDRTRWYWPNALFTAFGSWVAATCHLHLKPIIGLQWLLHSRAHCFLSRRADNRPDAPLHGLVTTQRAPEWVFRDRTWSITLTGPA